MWEGGWILNIISRLLWFALERLRFKSCFLFCVFLNILFFFSEGFLLPTDFQVTLPLLGFWVVGREDTELKPHKEIAAFCRYVHLLTMPISSKKTNFLN